MTMKIFAPKFQTWLKSCVEEYDALSGMVHLHLRNRWRRHRCTIPETLELLHHRLSAMTAGCLLHRLLQQLLVLPKLTLLESARKPKPTPAPLASQLPSWSVFCKANAQCEHDR